MRIVVTTPTGRVGSRVTRLLVQAGVRPRALLRDPARLDPALAPYVETVVADQRDGDAVLDATAGADALFWVDPPTGEPDPVQSLGTPRGGGGAGRSPRASGAPCSSPSVGAAWAYEHLGGGRDGPGG